MNHTFSSILTPLFFRMETDSMSPSGDVDVALSARLVSIYTALQKLDSDSSQEYFAHISTASRQYRSVIQEKISETNDASLLGMVLRIFNFLKTSKFYSDL